MSRPYLRVANVQRGWLNLEEIKTIRVTQDEARTLTLRSGDILMNEGGDRDKLGRGWVWEGQITDCIHQTHVFRPRVRNASVPPKYVSYYANAFGRQYFIDEGKQTTNLASISMRKVAALPVPVASPEEMEEVLRRIEAAFAWLDRVARTLSLSAPTSRNKRSVQCMWPLHVRLFAGHGMNSRRVTP